MNRIITQEKKINTSKFKMMFLFGILLLLNSCATEPIDELSKKINIALRNDNIIDESEWNSFTEFTIQNKQDFANIIGENNTINSEELNNLILSIANKRRDKQKPVIFNPTKGTNTELEKAEIKVFIENSGSMDGYVRGITDFEIAIGKMLVLSKDYSSKNNFNVNFINKEVYPTPEIEELTDFAKALEPKTGSPYYDSGNRSESILNEVLKHILDSTNVNDISILVSDCIYSLNSTQDTKGSLGYQQNGTMEAFLDKFNNQKDTDISTAIFKMKSNFYGTYYPYNYKRNMNNSINLYKQDIYRPYYIWILGSEKHIVPFLEKVKVESLKGFENSYFLSNSTKNKQPFYTVLKETNKKGNFKQTDRNKTDVKSINDIEYDNGKLQFSIALDLNNIPVDQAYLTNADNYIRPSGFSIESIEEVDRNKISRRDFLTVEKTTATHIITVSTTNEYSIRNLQLELSNKIPFWVSESNSINDTDIVNQLDKTFGLLYLIKGVSEAYITQNPDNTSYFKINVTIKK